jgi:hypothetical protein
MFYSIEDDKAFEELFEGFPSFGIKVGMDRRDFEEGKLHLRLWQIVAPDKNKIWQTGAGITFVEAYRSLLKRLGGDDDGV